MSEHTEAMVRVKGVCKIFGDDPTGKALTLLKEGVSKPEVLDQTGHVVALADVTFDVHQGELFVVMGLSGSGKSTLIRCVNRLIEPTAGDIYVDGENILEADKARLQDIRRTKISMVFQHFGLFPHRTVADNTAYGLKIQGVGEEERLARAQEALELVGLGEWGEHYPRNLSGGMQQRVGLARALAVDPEILLMDEPFSALDPLIRREMQQELLELQARLQKTILFITHDLNEAIKIGDRIAVMRGGRIVQLSPPQEIILNPADDYVAEFTEDLDPSVVITASHIMNSVEPLRLGEDSVQTAVARLKMVDHKGIFDTALYVIDDEGKPVGIVLEDDVLRAQAQGADDLAQIMRQEFPTAAPAAALEEISRLAVDGLPVAVVGSDGRLRGVADPQDVLANFGRKSKERRNTSEMTEPVTA